MISKKSKFVELVFRVPMDSFPTLFVSRNNHLTNIKKKLRVQYITTMAQVAMIAGVGLLCMSSGLGAAILMMKSDNEGSGKGDGGSGSNGGGGGGGGGGDDAPVDTRSDSVKESIDPENFTPSSPFTRLGEFRLLSGKSGYPYSQFFVDNPANAIEECKTACKDDSNCPGFSLDWHRGVDKVNCMVFKSNTGEAEAQSCVYKPFGGQCRSGVSGKPGVTEGGMWWRGTRISQ